MYHTAAYKGAVGQTANTDVAALTDSVLTISNGHFRLVDGMSLVAAAALGVTIQRARLDSPTLRLNGNPYILPVLVGDAGLTTPRIMYTDRMGFSMPQREEIALQSTSGLACGTETHVGLIWLSPGYTPPPQGRVQFVRVSSTTAAVAYTWTNIALTFESALPSGYWSVVGAYYVAVDAIAARLIVPGQVWRPGIMGSEAFGDWQPDGQINGRLGEMGRFVNDNPIQAEVLCVTTTAVHTLWLGLVQVASM